MVNFIICDDNKKILENVASIVDKIMMKNEFAYKKYLFENYDTNFDKVVKSKMPNKIYILDIEVPNVSGIDVARKIREKDIESIIVFLTSHDELGYIILKSEFFFLTFISKFDDYENKLKNAVKKSLLLLGKRTMIRFEDQGILYTIPVRDILFVTRDSIERKCIIRTDYTEFRINKSLVEVKAMLDDKFKQSHRACLVNMERVVTINGAKKIITFDNNMTTDLVTANFKKEVGNL